MAFGLVCELKDLTPFLSNSTWEVDGKVYGGNLMLPPRAAFRDEHTYRRAKVDR